MLWIRLRSPIFSINSFCSVNESLIWIRCSYTSVRFNFVLISHIEYFERSLNDNAFSYTICFQNSLMTLSHLKNMALYLFIHHMYFWFPRFSGYLNWHNNDFLVLCDAYVYAVPLLVRTINVLKMDVRF